MEYEIDLSALFQAAAMTALKLAGPILVISLVVGVTVAVFQAATQINEQTLTYVPKLLAITLVLFIAGGWMMQVLIDFFRYIFELMTYSL